MIARLGKISSYGAVSIRLRLSLSIRLSDDAGGWVPSLRKLSPASVRRAYASARVI